MAVSAIDWLRDKAPGFGDLRADEQNAIMQFSLLWSLFEGKALGTRASARAIIAVSEQWAEEDLLAKDLFAPHVAYFRDRYYQSGAFTHHFHNLHLQPSDQPALLERVLKNQATTITEVAAATLIIVYRFRNNLFHGVKWAYEIRGQFENFTHANAVLMQAIDLDDRSLLSR